MATLRLAVPSRLKPTEGFGHLFHLLLVALLPALVFVLVRINFIQLALVVILLSKWRMLAVRPRYWPANIQANGIDLIVGVSTLIFMIHTGSSWWQLLWAVLYGGWLVGLKPHSDSLFVSIQAVIGQFVAVTALFLEWPDAPLWGWVVGSGIICYIAARHFFDSYDEPYSKLLSYTWGYFGAALAWLLGHWLLFYGPISQLVILLSALGYGLASLYYLDHQEKLKTATKREFIFLMAVIIFIVLVALWQSTKRKII